MQSVVVFPPLPLSSSGGCILLLLLATQAVQAGVFAISNVSTEHPDKGKECGL